MLNSPPVRFDTRNGIKKEKRPLPTMVSCSMDGCLSNHTNHMSHTVKCVIEDVGRAMRYNLSCDMAIPMNESYRCQPD
ncbi:UNVERIFIED_CONTAM: hypothetical protein Slati_3107100 [Sesamum latifolium]|uniref:Uncharacterized protein n=1 Tax=Sesamum latifolium TaxID=2727402 RepID=A0AAW2UWH1_9LAMI